MQAKVCTLVPSQIRALRLKSENPRQPDLARAAEMHQSRISMLETPGANPTLGTLSAIAAALNVGLKVEFVPLSEMLEWENGFSQDSFEVTPLDSDTNFLSPPQQDHPQIAVSNLSACTVYFNFGTDNLNGTITASVINGSTGFLAHTFAGPPSGNITANFPVNNGTGAFEIPVMEKSWNSYAGPVAEHHTVFSEWILPIPKHTAFFERK